MDVLTQEQIFLKMNLVPFYEALGYPGGVTPSHTASKKQLKRLIETYLLVEAILEEAM